VIRESGRQVEEIHMHPRTWRRLVSELDAVTTYMSEETDGLPRFRGIPIHVHTWCERDMIYFPTSPL
jgi:hypothetical protein